jgi:ankyrin repeat protein
LKEDQYRYTILHDASYNGSKEIVRILLNTFNKEEENEQLIKFVMKEDKSKNTALYLTIINEHEDIVKLLLSVFDIKTCLVV